MIKGIIFDMDGLIIDTEKWLQKYYVKAACELGYDMKPEYVLQIRSLPAEYAIPLLKNLVGDDYDYYAVKELRKKGYSPQVISEKTGLHGFVVGKYAKQAERFKTRELREALEACVEADENVKTGKMNDVMSVEILICKYSSNQKVSGHN